MTQVPGRMFSAATAAVLVGSVLGLPAASELPDKRGPVAASSVLGTSVAGREIVAMHRSGAGPTVTTLLVIGQMHGNEPAGIRVVDELASMDLPPGLDLWLVPTLNPDGLAGHTRANARGVDLNRNFPKGWRKTAVSGQSRSSEPETRIATALLNRIRPDAVVSFHQSLYGVDTSVAKTRRFAKLLARHLKLPRKVFRCSYGCHGTMTEWYNAKHRGVAITVELNSRPSGALIRRSATGSVAAAMALAPKQADPTASPAPSTTPTVNTTPTTTPTPPPATPEASPSQPPTPQAETPGPTQASGPVTGIG